jgi:hypothetical protein
VTTATARYIYERRLSIGQLSKPTRRPLEFSKTTLTSIEANEPTE